MQLRQAFSFCKTWCGCSDSLKFASYFCNKISFPALSQQALQNPYFILRKLLTLAKLLLLRYTVCLLALTRLAVFEMHPFKAEFLKLHFYFLPCLCNLEWGWRINVFLSNTFSPFFLHLKIKSASWSSVPSTLSFKKIHASCPSSHMYKNAHTEKR